MGEKQVNKRFLRYVFIGTLFLFFLSGQYKTVDAASVITLNPGQTKVLKVPSGYKKNVKWSSTKKNIVYVDKNGKVTAKNVGKAVVSAKSGNKTKRYSIEVQKIQLNYTKLNLYVGSTKHLIAKNSVGKIKWVSNSKAVKVDSKGRVTAVKKGKATVTAIVFGKKYKCSVTVIERNVQQVPDNDRDHKIRIQVGEKSFSAVLYDNTAANELVKKLPFTFSMKELNGNEKYYYMPWKLPTNANKPDTIKSGDIMLYGADCIVLFYKNFNTSYTYTSIGYIENPAGLETALGNASVTVTFQMR